MDLLRHIFVINLDSRPDRLEHALSEFEIIDVSFERFPAIVNSDGAVGCSMSHIRCLELAIERDYDYVFICEDDITFTRPEVFLSSLKQFQESQPESWDVLMIGGVVYSDKGDSYQSVENFYARVYEAQTTTGYIIPRYYMSTLLKNFKDGLSGFVETGNRWTYSIDSYWKALQCRDLWFFLTPPTVIQYANWSNIEGAHTDYGRGMLCLQNVPVKIE
jgi:glycosyl transferase family 25